MLKYDNLAGQNRYVMDRMIYEIGKELEGELREAIKKLPRGGGMVYDDSTANKIKFFPEDKVVGSKDWSVSTLNYGFPAGVTPNIDRIKYWVQFVKGGGENSNSTPEDIQRQTHNVIEKIVREGIPAHWYVDKVLNDFGGKTNTATQQKRHMALRSAIQANKNKGGSQ